MRRNIKAQISLEYLILIGFIMFGLVGILGISYYYQSSLRDRIRDDQLQKFSEKIVSSAEQVFYAGMPSKATIEVYLPQGVTSIEVIDDSLVISMQVSSLESKQSFVSNVPIVLDGEISTSYGYKKIQITANETDAIISQA